MMMESIGDNSEAAAAAGAACAAAAKPEGQRVIALDVEGMMW